MRVQEAVDDYLAVKESSTTFKTFRTYKQKLTPFAAWCEEQSISLEELRIPAQVYEFLKRIPDNVSDYTRRGYVREIKAFLNWCAKDEETYGVRGRAVDRIELPKVDETEIETYSPQEVEALFAACKKMPFPERDYALLAVLADTGVRISEVCYDSTRPHERTGLYVVDVHLSNPSDAHIRVIGKGRKYREVGLGKRSRLALNKYITYHRGRPANEYVFQRRGMEPLTVRGAEQIIQDLGELVGVRAYAHKFRHTFAVNYLLQGGSDIMLSKLLGHTTLEMTNKYTRAMTQQQARSGKSVLDRLHGGY